MRSPQESEGQLGMTMGMRMRAVMGMGMGMEEYDVTFMFSEKFRLCTDFIVSSQVSILQ